MPARWTGRGILARFFNFLMGGRNNLPLSRLNLGGLSPKLMTGMMKIKNVATLEELFGAANVPRTVTEQGHQVLSIRQEGGIHHVLIRKA